MGNTRFYWPDPDDPMLSGDFTVVIPFKPKRVMCVACQDEGCEFCPRADAVPDSKEKT